jgi:4-amino-4-deoxy-L-arabinose transferase-like glycosyltransferase
MNQKDKDIISNRTITSFNKGAFWCLIIFAIIYSSLGLFWMIYDKRPPLWDPAQYLDESVIFYRAISINFLDFLRLYKNAFWGAKAPLISLLPLPFYLLFGSREIVLKSLMVILIILFILVSYWLFRQYLNEWAAVFACIFLSLMPLNIGMSRNFYVEYTLSISIMLWMIALLKSNLLRSKKFDLLLGIILGFGLLLKVNFPLYAGPPAIVFFIYRIILISKEEKWKVDKRVNSLPIKSLFMEIGFISIPALLIAGSWYLFNFKAVLDFGYSSSFGEISKGYSLGNPLDLNTLFAYGLQLVNYAISPYIFFSAIFILLIVGIVWIYKKKTYGIKTTAETEEMIIVRNCKLFATLFWFITPLIFTSLATNKLTRFVEPVLPVFALCVALSIEFVARTRKQKILLGTVFLVFPIIELIYLSIPMNRNLNITTGNIIWLSNDLGQAKVVSKDNWHVPDIIHLIQKDFEVHTFPPGTLPYVVITSNNPYFNQNAFNYYAGIEQLSFRFEPSYGVNKNDWLIRAKKRIENAPYIITKPGGTVWLYNSDEVLTALDKGELPFIKVGSFNLPDGTQSIIYRRNIK